MIGLMQQMDVNGILDVQEKAADGKMKRGGDLGRGEGRNENT